MSGIIIGNDGKLNSYESASSQGGDSTVVRLLPSSTANTAGSTGGTTKPRRDTMLRKQNDDSRTTFVRVGQLTSPPGYNTFGK